MNNTHREAIALIRRNDFQDAKDLLIQAGYSAKSAQAQVWSVYNTYFKRTKKTPQKGRVTK